jgi:8-oxo-dGTP diphosphatase
MVSEPSAVAAGVLLWRGAGAAPEFLLLRNARHATWGFAKGHLEPGEDLIAGALRECREETGYVLTPADLITGFADASFYRTPSGVLKRVVMFLAAAPASAAGFTRSPEHDEHAWCGLDAALSRVVHEELRRSLVRAATLLAQPAP